MLCVVLACEEVHWLSADQVIATVLPLESYAKAPLYTRLVSSDNVTTAVFRIFATKLRRKPHMRVLSQSF